MRVLTFVFALVLAVPVAAQPTPEKAATLEELLERVEQRRLADDADARRREAIFRENRDRRQALLDETRQNIARAEARSARLENTFSGNEAKLAELDALLGERLGVFKELFGTVRRVAGETEAQLAASLISGELKDRTAPLAELTATRDLPRMEQLEMLWVALQREMTAQAAIARFEGDIIGQDGAARRGEILRVGPFTALHDGRFLRYAGDGRFAELPRRPPARFEAAGDDLSDADAGEIVGGVVDPSRGGLLDALIRTPTLGERIGQGGLIGTIILLLGAGGLALGGQRIWHLTRLARQTRDDLARSRPARHTPLGRIWAAYEAGRDVDIETLERRLDDAILKEIPPLEYGLPMLKLLAGAAPLLGLLGTVTGMIVTFQAITLFGAGDPKLMAGGISQALVTTVLGLVVALPVLLLHGIAAARAREIAQLLEEQATGAIVAHADAVQSGDAP